MLAVFSGVPRILEWEGSKCRRRRGVWGVGRNIPLLTGEGSEEGAVPPQPLPRKFFVFFVVENTIFRRILTRLFLKIIRQWEGFYPLTPSSVRHWQ